MSNIIMKTVAAGLKPGDLLTERVANMEHDNRTVVIDSITEGETWYHGELRPILYVAGRDTRNNHHVKWTRTPMEFEVITRQVLSAK